MIEQLQSIHYSFKTYSLWSEWFATHSFHRWQN